MPASVLSHRSMLRLGGADRIPFLQGLISNDIALCTPEKSLYATLLTPQGKFLHDMFVYHAGEEFLIDCESARADDLVQRFTTYKLRAKVEIENIADKFDVVAFIDGSQGLSDPRLPALGTRGFVAKGKESGDDKLYDHHRLTLGVPDGSRDMIVGKSTLSDGNIDLLNGISWTKGCYVGQELTARMHHRALVKKRMFPVKISGAVPEGSLLQFNGKEIGEMRSSQKDVGLALLNIEIAQQAISQNKLLTCEGASFAPYQPEWLKIP